MATSKEEAARDKQANAEWKARTKAPMREVVLCAVEEGSFRNSEKTLFAAWSKSKGNTLTGTNDIVIFVSLTRNIMYFVHGHRVVRGSDSITKVLWSEKLRLDTGDTWNPLMLVNYAERVGLKLVGLKRFEEFYKKLTDE